MSTKNIDKLPKIAKASKIQDGLSFKDLLQVSVEAKKPQKQAEARKTEESSVKQIDTEVPAEKSLPKETPKETTIPIAQEHKELPLSQNVPSAIYASPSTSTYEVYYKSCVGVTFVDSVDKSIHSPVEKSLSLQTDAVTFSHGIPHSMKTSFIFGRMPTSDTVHRISQKPHESNASSDTLSDYVKNSQTSATDGKLSAPYVAPSTHHVRPPTLHDNNQVFNNSWLPLPERFSTGSDNATNLTNDRLGSTEGVSDRPHLDVGAQGYVNANQPMQGYRKDFLHPNRRVNHYPRRRHNDFFGHMMPPGYPPVPGAYDFHSQFQMPFPQQGMQNPNPTHVPPNFHPPYFMNNFHQPPARQDTTNSADMYGMPPNCMNYGPHYPMNYGSH